MIAIVIKTLFTYMYYCYNLFLCIRNNDSLSDFSWLIDSSLLFSCSIMLIWKWRCISRCWIHSNRYKISRTLLISSLTPFPSLLHAVSTTLLLLIVFRKRILSTHSPLPITHVTAILIPHPHLLSSSVITKCC